jgi:hypothetical protein
LQSPDDLGDLALRSLALLDGVASFVHPFLHKPDWVRSLCGWVNTFLGNESSDLSAESIEVVFPLLLIDLNFTFL